MRLGYHKEMKPRRQEDPRANQKARTRKALVDAAAAMFREGSEPTVAEAADAAKVSRATAYRYFPTQDALLVEVAGLGPAVAPVDAMLAELRIADPEGRLIRLLDTLHPIVFDEEVPMRTALRIYLDTWLEARRKGEPVPVVREGRRMHWLEIVLEPVRKTLPKARWHRLQAALALTLSIDAMVVMKDVCRLDDDDAQDVLRWAARALLRAGLAEASATNGRRAAKKI
jgi:AcrR family transcriptional regulator